MKLQRVRGKIRAAILVGVLMAAPAIALDLSEAKSAGLVGETSSGYLGAVESSGDVDELVASINSQRKAHYAKIAEKNGIKLEAVEARAGEKAIERSAPGAYINTGDGWRKK